MDFMDMNNANRDNSGYPMMHFDCPMMSNMPMYGMYYPGISPEMMNMDEHDEDKFPQMEEDYEMMNHYDMPHHEMEYHDNMELHHEMPPYYEMHGMVPMFTDIDDEEDYEDEDERSPVASEATEIHNKIKVNNPEIYNLLRRYGISPIASHRIIRRIINLTLKYHK